MANFRNKIFGLAGASLIFAGMAYGQAANCTALNANGLSQVDRAESVTDLVAETVLTCSTAYRYPCCGIHGRDGCGHHAVRRRAGHQQAAANCGAARRPID